jgi:uncharacterized protein (DUF2062 family)
MPQGTDGGRQCRYAVCVASFFERRVKRVLLDLLKQGATPERLAWSLAVGLVVGINPLLGSTTVLSLALAGTFRLNIVATQIATHLAYPLELLLFAVFIKLGSLLFDTPGLPLHRRLLIHLAHHHPWETTKMLWHWEWHALVAWLLLAAVGTPALAAVFRPALRHLAERRRASAATA